MTTGGDRGGPGSASQAHVGTDRHRARRRHPTGGPRPLGLGVRAVKTEQISWRPVSWSTDVLSAWAGEAGTIATVATLVVAVWLATAEGRRRRRDEAESQAAAVREVSVELKQQGEHTAAQHWRQAAAEAGSTRCGSCGPGTGRARRRGLGPSPWGEGCWVGWPRWAGWSSRRSRSGAGLVSAERAERCGDVAPAGLSARGSVDA